MEKELCVRCRIRLGVELATLCEEARGCQDAFASLVEVLVLPWLQERRVLKGDEFHYERGDEYFVCDVGIRFTGVRDGCRVVALEFEPSDVWAALRRRGACVLSFRDENSARAVFDSFRVDRATKPLDKTSTKNHGWHDLGWTKYNEFRRGYIFQADQPVDDLHETFRRQAYELLRERFAYEDTDVISQSQFHVKECVSGGGVPAHRDPSLVSLVIHNDTGGGFEFFADGSWWPSHQYGPHLATLIAGRVLEHVGSDNKVRALKHRVAEKRRELPSGSKRLAATFFFQPCDEDDTLLLLHKKTTFAEWKARAYRSYGLGSSS